MFTKSHCEEINGYRWKRVFVPAVCEENIAGGPLHTLALHFFLTLSSIPELHHGLTQHTAGHLLA